MEEKPRINFQRFQSPKIKRKYILKFGLYVIVLVSLWIWYGQVSSKASENQSVEKIELEKLEINDVTIEP